MPKERNKADLYREKAYEGDTKAMNNLIVRGRVVAIGYPSYVSNLQVYKRT